MNQKKAQKKIKTRKVVVPIYCLTAYVHFAKTCAPLRDAYGLGDRAFEGVVWVDEDEDIHVGFSEEHLSIPTIAHEALHMTNRVFWLIGYVPTVDNDEAQAYLITFFVDAILDAQNKLGVGKMKQQG